MTISKEIDCAEHDYMNIAPPNYRSSGAPVSKPASSIYEHFAAHHEQITSMIVLQ